jgi:imidazolonepropionase-like amidohydrolase
MRKLLIINAFVFICFSAIGQAIPGSVLIEHVIAHTANGVIENAVIGIQGDSIVLLADSRVIRLDKSRFETIFDGKGNHVWPGFIALNSSIGLREIDAVRATLDYAEVGSINSHVRSLTAFNTDSRIIPTIRSNGVLTVQACPQRGLISGSSSIFHLSGWNWEDAVVKVDDGIHLNWPASPLHLQPADTSKKPKTNEKELAELHRFFAESKAYVFENPAKRNLRLEAMKPIFEGKTVLYIHAERARDIQDAVWFSKQYGIERICIVGGSESHLVIDELRKNGVSVILPRVHRLPELPNMPPEAVFSQASTLVKAGILVALSYDGEMEAMGTRNLPFTAGTTTAYGLSEIEALNLISLNPAKIVGIDKTEGSLEVGKKATFFMSNGDALDMRTGGAIKIWISGLEVSVDNEQKELYRKYIKKYGIPE